MNWIKRICKKIYLNTIDYIISNRLFLAYVVFAFIGTVILRYATLGDKFDIVTGAVELAFILILGSFAYLFKPQKRFKYLFIILFILYFINCANSIYYTFYANFTSLNLLASLSQTGEVADSVIDRLHIIDFIYIIFLIIFYYIHRLLKRSTYYNYMSYSGHPKKMFGKVICVALLLLIFVSTQLTKTDYSRLAKQWNREYIVKRFGIIMYQGNDIIQSLIPKFNSFFGYEEAVKEYNEFYTNNQIGEYTNKYTNIFKGKNIIFIHMESIQSNLLDMSFNGNELVPNVKKLANEGMYFSNFYPQISVGTSSDTEFTLNTSLMPALSGTVAVSYYDREYLTIEKLLKQQGYYTFSMHGNKASMWNREKLHASFGYDRFYSEKDYEVTDENTIGLGISDHDFFIQSLQKLEEIEQNNTNYMGTIITLSNHSPFNDLDKYGDYSLAVETKKYDSDTDTYKTISDDYLEDTELGNYFHSSHYADMALGEFIEYIKDSNYFNDTIFVFYGDHDAKISREEYNKYYNYSYEEGRKLTKNDDNYNEFDSYDYDIDKNTPLIIWSKNDTLNDKIKGTYSYKMGMYDVLPTIGNMFGFSSPYAMGHDIFETKNNNIVIFPNGNFITDKVYYSNSTGEFRVLKKNATIDEQYIEDTKNYMETRLEVSNNIIVHDLIRKVGLVPKESETKDE